MMYFSVGDKGMVRNTFDHISEFSQQDNSEGRRFDCPVLGVLGICFPSMLASLTEKKYIILIYSPGLKHTMHHISIIKRMPLIDIQILAVCRMFVT